jgi:hypothetical protein
VTVRSDRHYVRVYHDDLLRDYPEIYADDGALSTWLRLLVIADKMWPTPPELPRSVKPRPLRVLAEYRLVELVPPHGFRIRGHDAERSRRADAARNAAALRWQDRGNADSNAEGHADVMPSTRPRRDEPNLSPPPAKLGQRNNGTNPRAIGTNPRATGTSPRQKRAAEKRGGMPDSVAAILARAAKAGSS